MAVTLTEVSTPNAPQTWGVDGNNKTHTLDVTFDNSYPTTGEVVTAAQLGFTMVLGAKNNPAFAANAAGTLGLPVYVEANAAQTQVTLQVFRYDGASAGKASLEEAANAFDASLFTARIEFYGN